MTYDEFKEKVERQFRTHEAHGKAVREGARDEENLRRAYDRYGERVAHAAFALLTGRDV